jgi:cytochrome c oxidase subunit III
MAQSTAEELSPHTHESGGHAHGAGHGENPFLAHHFDTPKHQFESGKLGIWLFLVTEVLFFGGLFCAYAVYRSLHPEIFVYAHYYLDTFWGALNTGVLIVSSLTAAWAVRNAQLGEQKKLVANIIITIVLACVFLCVKYVEYSHKFHDNVLPGRHFNPTHEVWELESYKKAHGEHAGAGHETAHPAPAAPETNAPTPTDTTGNVQPAQPAAGEGAGTAPEKVAPPGALKRPRHASVFFSIYFFMTGLHGVHVIAGIITWLWLLRRALRGEFGPQHFGAIDYAALYWHLVDLIWIYLFPLLYLIH